MKKSEKVARLTQAVRQANMTFNHLTNLSDEDRLFIEGFKKMCVAAEVQYTQPPQQISVPDEVIPDDDYSRGWRDGESAEQSRWEAWTT